MQKYGIDVENTIGVYYRGTDKKMETVVPDFESFVKTLLGIMKSSQKVLIQSDSAQFHDYVKAKIPASSCIIIEENAISYTDKGLHYEHTKKQNQKDIQYLFATFLILSQCQDIVCTSSNGGIWMMYYRGHADRVCQFLNGKWF